MLILLLHQLEISPGPGISVTGSSMPSLLFVCLHLGSTRDWFEHLLVDMFALILHWCACKAIRFPLTISNHSNSLVKPDRVYSQLQTYVYNRLRVRFTIPTLLELKMRTRRDAIHCSHVFPHLRWEGFKDWNCIFYIFRTNAGFPWTCLPLMRYP